ncbi:Cyc2 [Kluyveromyces lactis]|nr:Cyc2 [Kluyveromyces lactis]
MKLLLGSIKRLSSSSKTTLPQPAAGKSSSLLKTVLLLSSSVAIGGLSWNYYKESLYQRELSRDYFSKYKISKKYSIDQDHYLIELTPLKAQKVNLWKEMNSSKLWSVEVKQPEIMVVRSYTPLPLTIEENGTVEVLRDGENASGALTFYIKQYKQGEVARWINHLPLGHVLELRGPFVEYEFPDTADEITRDRSFLWENEDCVKNNYKYQPFDILFFTGGTGIVPLLQMTLTESPFRGKIGAYHSCKSLTELGPLNSILTKLQDNDRIELHTHESKRVSVPLQSDPAMEGIPSPYPYGGNKPFTSLDSKVRPVLSLVCGPDGFISTVSGPKYDLVQGPIKGILAARGWDNSNVYKLS